MRNLPQPQIEELVINLKHFIKLVAAIKQRTEMSKGQENFEAKKSILIFDIFFFPHLDFAS